jgi:hypothetical protein
MEVCNMEESSQRSIQEQFGEKRLSGTLIAGHPMCGKSLLNIQPDDYVEFIQQQTFRGRKQHKRSVTKAR